MRTNVLQLWVTEYIKAPAVLDIPRGVTQEVSAPMPSQFNPKSTTESIPHGLCQCGCGEETSIAARNYHDRGIVKGEHMRFRPGHVGRAMTGPRKERPNPVRISDVAFAIPLVGDKSGGRVALVSPSDVGKVSGYRWYLMSTDGKEYAVTKPHGDRSRTLLMHRVILEPEEGLVVDHVNGDGLDNRRDNIRVGTQADNLRNSSRSRTRKISPYRGVQKVKRGVKWRAHIQGKVIGYFDSAVEAAIAYDNEARIRFGNFGVLNFPGEGERGERDA